MRRIWESTSSTEKESSFRRTSSILLRHRSPGHHGIRRSSRHPCSWVRSPRLPPPSKGKVRRSLTTTWARTIARPASPSSTCKKSKESKTPKTRRRIQIIWMLNYHKGGNNLFTMTRRSEGKIKQKNPADNHSPPKNRLMNKSTLLPRKRNIIREIKIKIRKKTTGNPEEQARMAKS